MLCVLSWGVARGWQRRILRWRAKFWAGSAAPSVAPAHILGDKATKTVPNDRGNAVTDGQTQMERAKKKRRKINSYSHSPCSSFPRSRMSVKSQFTLTSQQLEEMRDPKRRMVHIYIYIIIVVVVTVAKAYTWKSSRLTELFFIHTIFFIFMYSIGLGLRERERKDDWRNSCSTSLPPHHSLSSLSYVCKKHCKDAVTKEINWHTDRREEANRAKLRALYFFFFFFFSFGLCVYMFGMVLYRLLRRTLRMSILVRPVAMGDWAPQSFFFFSPFYLFVFIFTSDNSSAPHFSWQLLWDRLAYQDPRQVFELFSKILSSVRASTSNCRVPRVKRSKNTLKIFIRISSLPES
jgi:hypothetical protein